MWLTIASSKSSPAMRTDSQTLMSAREMIATSVVPPPISTIMLAVGSVTGSPAPIAAAIGSSTRNAAGPRALGAVSTAPLFHGRDARWDGDDHARADEMLAPMDAADEVAEHRLGDFEVADDAVFQRADGGDRAGRFAEHFLGDQADGVAVLQHAVGAFLDGDHAGLVEDDPFAFDANEGVAGAQVDAHVDAEHPQKRIKNHAGDSSANGPLNLDGPARLDAFRSFVKPLSPGGIHAARGRTAILITTPGQGRALRADGSRKCTVSPRHS